MANGIVVAALFGQFLTGQTYSIGVAFVGFITWLALWALTLALAEDGLP